MDGYKCIVRLEGEIGQTVPKVNISAAHIIMLEQEHGEGSVVEVEKTSSTLIWPAEQGKPEEKVTNKMMREFLEEEFGKEKVGKIFGAFYGVKLPEVIEGFEKTKATKKINKSPKAEISAKIPEEEPADDEDVDTDDESEDVDTDKML